MKSFSVSIRISARPEEIWAILTDAADYPSWNPTVEKVEGRIAPGQRVTVHAKISPGRAFPLSVTEFVPAKRMVWTGGLPFGLFTGERTFELTPSEGGVEFSMREAFRGLLSPLITRSIPDLQPSFEAFAAALKRRAEGLASSKGR